MSYWRSRECLDVLRTCSATIYLASGRSRSNALIALVTAVVTIATSAIALPAFGWQAAGWSACLGMIAQIVITMVLLRQIVNLVGVWPRIVHFVLLPLATGIVTALALRHFVSARLIRPSSALVARRGLLCCGGRHHLCRSRCRFKDRTLRRHLLARYPCYRRPFPAYGYCVAMCGIAGIVNLDGQAVEPSEISAFDASIGASRPGRRGILVQRGA